MLEKQCYAMVALELVGFEWPIFATDKRGLFFDESQKVTNKFAVVGKFF